MRAKRIGKERTGRHKMSYSSRQELLEAAHKRYVKAGRKEKSTILSEVCENTGFHRKHAIRALNTFVTSKYYYETRGRKKKYHEPRFIAIIKELREGCGNICAELFHDHLQEAVTQYEQWKAPLPDDIKENIRTISVSTLKRILPGAYEAKSGVRKTYAHTSPLCASIPLQNSCEKPTMPGCMEVDLVEHNGGNPEGQYLYTLTAIDKVTNWVVRRCIANKSAICVHAALNDVVDATPYSLYWIDTDNGGEFLNGLVAKWIADKQYRHTRSRKGKKNDNAHVERANCVYVRELIGYARFTSDAALRCINHIYNADEPYCNYFVPGRKMIKKTYDTSTGKSIKKYDTATPPFQRVLTYYNNVDNNRNTANEICEYITRIRDELNPWKLLKQRETYMDKLAHMRT